MTSAATMIINQPVPLLERAMTGLPPVSLETVTAAADLQTRVDRKYLLRPEAADAMLAVLAADALVLEIDGTRSFAYESVYFDTPERTSYLAAAHGRRRRFKVRTRTYADSGACVLEVKTTGGRGETIKVRAPYGLEHHDVLTPEGQAFVDGVLGDDVAATLEPALTTGYQRSTLLGAALDFRLTIDSVVTCWSPDGASLALADHVLVETKSRSAPTRPDRLLWAMGHRPVRISKYCVGLAALNPELPANRWHRTLSQHLQLR